MICRRNDHDYGADENDDNPYRHAESAAKKVGDVGGEGERRKTPEVVACIEQPNPRAFGVIVI